MTNIEQQPNQPIRARIRRLYIADALYFITCVTSNRRPLFSNPNSIGLLRKTIRRVKQIYPFQMRAYAFLPDHFHLLLHPEEEGAISRIMHSIKRNFTVNYKNASGAAEPTNLWQRGFWDHVIRDEQDYLNHLNYIHYNPVKHGLATRAINYEYSSFRYYFSQGWYDEDWGNIEPIPIRDWSFE